MKNLIYTATFGGYDTVFFPVSPPDNTDCVIFTDSRKLKVRGWRTIWVDPAPFPTAKVANLYYRALINKVLPGYALSLYVDGNIRILRHIDSLFQQLHVSGSALAFYHHPTRRTIAEEAEAILRTGKAANPDDIGREVARYFSDGYDDSTELMEAGVLLRNHSAPKLDEAMALWWQLFDTYRNRDQLSLPYVIWKTGLDVHYLPGSFRRPNPHFAIYPHSGAAGVNALYAYLSARSHDSRRYRWALDLWHCYWEAQRKRQSRFARRGL